MSKDVTRPPFAARNSASSPNPQPTTRQDLAERSGRARSNQAVSSGRGAIVAQGMSSGLATPSRYSASNQPVASPRRSNSVRNWLMRVRSGSTARQYSPLVTPEEFRRYGHQLIDWIADYRT